MASTAKPERSEDLNESWVELHYNQHGSGKTDTDTPPTSSAASASLTPRVSCTGSLEKLLIDAQRESRTPSRPNSNETSPGGSPDGPSSPNSEWSSEEWRRNKDPGTDWIWDWSSRPELPQSFDNWSGKFRHPGSKPYRAPMSVRNTQVMKKTQLFSLANLPTLLFSHACTFFLGAAAVLFYFKKYYNLSSIAHAALD